MWKFKDNSIQKPINDLLDLEKEKILKIKGDKTLTGRLYLITLGTALLILAVCIRGPEQRGYVIKDDSGNAVGIERNTLNNGENYEFNLSIKDGEDIENRKIKISVQAVRDEEENVDFITGGDSDAELEAAIYGMVYDIEHATSKKITLPTQLSDGKILIWTQIENKDYSNLILIPAIYIALIAFVIKSSDETEKSIELAHRNSIIRGLPRFCNQLYMMMNAGMILKDAFERITQSYEVCIDKDAEACRADYFKRELVYIFEKDTFHRSGAADILKEFAVKNDVKELIRIATILTENEKRGSDVIESLSRESRYLWDERRVVARENGKMIDSKMSYPLGILLILLIVITMAPAMLGM